MKQSSKDWTDRRLESIISRLLTAGVLIAALVVASGGILYLYRHGLSLPDYRVFRGEPSDLKNLGGIVGDVKALHARGIIQMGLLLLIATPVARVAFSTFVFLQLKDRLYVAISLIVLTLLLYSLLGTC